MSDKPDRKIYEQAFSDSIPQNKALGLEVVEIARGRGVMRLPWKQELVGDPETGVLHGGAITTMLDACSGMAVASMLSKPQPFATLDLRIDYVRPATTGEAVIAEAECYRITSNVAFTRAFAHHGDPTDPIAAASGTFMLATKGTPRTKETLIRADGGKGESA
jgi:uncharacterized protein (TIGR00369 family)